MKKEIVWPGFFPYGQGKSTQKLWIAWLAKKIYLEKKNYIHNYIHFVYLK